jgi:hypothetical protein
MSFISANIRKYIIPALFFGAVLGYAAYLVTGYIQARRDLAVASKLVDYLYASFNARNYEKMYESAAFEGCAKCTIKLDRFRDIMRFVMEKLGPVQSYARTGYSVRGQGASTRVEMRFRVVHEKGVSDESIVLLKKGDEWQLTDYHIQSEALKGY